MPTQTTSLPHPPGRKTIGGYLFSGLCASLVSIGLARFGYAPLLPVLIQQHWFPAGDAAYLGAANLAGYLLGALAAHRLIGHVSNVTALRMMMVLTTAAFLACGFPISVAWFFGWRLLSGVAGGIIMILVTSTILPHVPGTRKGLATGGIFLGMGLGIAGSGTLIPFLLQMGLREAWFGLAALSALFTAASWFGWPPSSPLTLNSPGKSAKTHGPHHANVAFRLFYLETALMAASLVPGTVFLVDFITRELGAGTGAGGHFWMLYGVGAIVGPPLYGILADRMGIRLFTRLVLLLQGLAAGSLYQTGSYGVIAFSTLAIGSFATGVVPVFLARTHDLIPHDTGLQNVVWARVTIVTAASMAAAGYACSAILSISGGNHRLLFLSAAIMLLLALAIGPLVKSLRLLPLFPF